MTTSTTDQQSGTRRGAGPVYSILVGLAALDVLLQGVWAGIFLKPGGISPDNASFIDVHARGADLGIALGVLATAYALWKLRERKDLWIGSLVFTVLMVLEAYLGGLVSDGKDGLTVIHFPLAMALMGLAVWLPLRARRG